MIDLESLSNIDDCHHRRNAASGGRLTVEELADRCPTWTLVRSLRRVIVRHRLSGISCFSKAAFEAQFAVPGLVGFRAVDDAGETVGMVLWFCQGNVGYYHLAAYTAPAHRVDTHIFLCVLAYHLLVAIETTLLNQGVHTSWVTV